MVPKNSPTDVEVLTEGRPGPPDTFEDVDGDSLIGGVVRLCRGNGMAPSTTAPAMLATHDGEDAETVDSALAIGWMLSTSIDDDEPPSVAAALSGPNGPKWLAALETELQNLESKGTWTEVKRPEGRPIIGSRWVLKVKRDALGEIIKSKARLVAQGFSQVPEVDFEQTYAPVGRKTSLRIMLAIAASMDLEIQQADVKGVYLNGTLDVDTYMRYPTSVTPSPGCDALKLSKALYGLKQAGRLWWKELGGKLEQLGFSKLHSDWGL
ncbi:hypothetical protein NCC49_005244, partial [Naganishia albida]